MTARAYTNVQIDKDTNYTIYRSCFAGYEDTQFFGDPHNDVYTVIDYKPLLTEYIDVADLDLDEKPDVEDILNTAVIRLIVGGFGEYSLIVDYKNEADYYSIRLQRAKDNTTIYETTKDSAGGETVDECINDLENEFNKHTEHVLELIDDLLYRCADNDGDEIAHRGLINPF